MTITVAPWKPAGRTPEVILMHGIDHTLTAFGEGWSSRLVMPFGQLHDVPVPIVDITAVPPRRLIGILKDYGAMDPSQYLDAPGLMEALVEAGGFVSLPTRAEDGHVRII